MLRLSDLRVIHHLKTDAAPVGPTFVEAFEIDSCLRRAWITDGRSRFTIPDGFDLFSGIEAYEFLLRLVCGLESRIAGETDIFGQFKEGWQRFSSQDGPLAEDLAPWIQKLFEDAKEIRSLYLRSVGGASYGSLVRKLVGGDLSGVTLLIGAGRLAQSVAPFLANSQGNFEGELWIWNRTRERAEELAEGGRALSRAEELTWALERASRAVVCIPFDAAEDVERIRLWRAAGARRPLIHLGGLRSQAGEWPSLEGYAGLDELFDLARAQDIFRATQVTRAREACVEKAKLRALGGSSATQHGWEDLAVFARG